MVAYLSRWDNTQCIEIYPLYGSLYLLWWSIITSIPVTDLAQHHLSKHNITAIRRVRKSDNNRIARACGATIAHRTDELREEDIGTGCGLFEVRKIGDEYFTYLVQCKDPKACSVVLRGPSKDILQEVQWCIHVLIDGWFLCLRHFFYCWPIQW